MLLGNTNIYCVCSILTERLFNSVFLRVYVLNLAFGLSSVVFADLLCLSVLLSLSSSLIVFQVDAIRVFEGCIAVHLVKLLFSN